MAGAAIYKGLTQAELDAQVDPRVSVPGFQAYIDRWNTLGDAARRAIECERDIAYGLTPAEKLDIYHPAGRKGPHPVMIYIHGGFWFLRSKEERAFLAPAITAAGVMTAIIDYALAPGASMDEMVAQCRRAVLWVSRNIAAHGGDPNRIYVVGESAGGHLTAAVAATDWAAEGANPAPTLRGVFAMSGIYDLEPIALSFLQSTLKLTPEQVARHSPIRQVRKVPTQLILAVGLDESPEYIRQMNAYSAALAAGGIRHDLVRCGATNHYSILDRLCDPKHMLHLSLMRLMRP